MCKQHAPYHVRHCPSQAIERRDQGMQTQNLWRQQSNQHPNKINRCIETTATLKEIALQESPF